MIFIFLILTTIVRSCELYQIQTKEVCEDVGNVWRNDQCVSEQTDLIGNSSYCANISVQIKCVSDTSCAWYNGICENFIGCQAYLKPDHEKCQTSISVNCNSIPGNSACQEKPTQCSSLSQTDCGNLDHKYGQASSCAWNQNSCAFKGCNNADITISSSDDCQKYHANCKYDGINCVDKLNTCDYYTVKQDCQKAIASTGKCQFENGVCATVRCYDRTGSSLEECNKYTNSQGSQCTFDKNVGDICLEPNYREDVEKYLKNYSSQDCKQKLSLLDLFKAYGNSNISLCYEYNGCENQDPSYCVQESCKLQQKWCVYSKNNNCQQVYDCRTRTSEATCDTTLCRYQKNKLQKIQECSEIQSVMQCNNAKNPQLRYCYWDSNTQNCQTLYFCSQITNLGSEDNCSVHNCKLVQSAKSNYCVEIMRCQFYSQEQCTNNPNYKYKLSDRCIWDKGACRQSNCEDIKDNCSDYNECVFTVKKECKIKNKAQCSDFEKDNCNQKHCVYVDSCIEVNQFTIQTLAFTKKEDCQKYSRGLTSNANGRNCILKTTCENFSLRDCDGMIDIYGFHCIESNSRCKVPDNCQEIKKKTIDDCYRIKQCSTNGFTCIDPEQYCSNYKNDKSCQFQNDSTICIWINNKCRVMECSDLRTKQDCDSRKLCKDPLQCYPNQCIYNKIGEQSTCHTLKSKCHYYTKNECTKSVEGYCYWNNVSCQQLFDCSQIKQEQICTQAYLQNHCQYRFQCENVTCQNSDNQIIRSLSEYFSCSNVWNEKQCDDLDGMLNRNQTYCYSCQNQTYSSYCMGINRRPLKVEVLKMYY